MPLAFINNKHFVVGNTTNNVAYAAFIALDPNEPPNKFTQPFMNWYICQYMLLGKSAKCKDGPPLP